MSMHFAKALVFLGVKERACITIQGMNSPEHLTAMMGSVLSNCIYSDIYMTNSPEICLKEIKETKTKVIVCDTYKRLKSTFIDHHDEEYAAMGVIAYFLFAEGTTKESAANSF